MGQKKKIVILGKGSYIGEKIKEWLNKTEDYYAYEVDAYNSAWEEESFIGVNAIIHVAGIVHKKNIKDWNLYYSVNTELPFIVAQKAKNEGVQQFVFLSTMAVYGKSKRLTKKSYIDRNTTPKPKTFYGKSKWMAENKLLSLESNNFKVCCLRLPNVYGKNCRGNYIKGFTNVLKKLPMIPGAYLSVKQSMLYIDNLSALCYGILSTQRGGIYMPQDYQPVSAVELLYTIAVNTNYKKNISRLLGIGVYLLSFLPIVKKAYGGVAYLEELSVIEGIDYVVVPFQEAIRRTVNE